MCVKSALSQTYKNIEVIIINDGSNNEYTFLEEMSKNKEKYLLIRKMVEYFQQCIFNNGIYKCVDTPWAKIYKNSFLKEQNISFDEKLKYGEDGLFNYNVYTSVLNFL